MTSSLLDFAPLARRYVIARRVSSLSLLSLIVLVLTLLLVARAPLLAILAGCTLWLASLIGAYFAYMVKCTQCHGGLRRADGPFCPECGARALIDSPWPAPRTCGNCHRSLEYRRGHRRFTVRYCSQCGAHLCEQGI
jgi:hypothetical protein